MKKNKKLLVIDLQGLQTSSFDRGMGRYSRTLIKNLKTFIHDEKYCRILFLLNSNLSSKHVLTDLREVIKNNEQLIFIDYYYQSASKETLALAQKSVDEYFDSKYSEYTITYFILSNFELGQIVCVFPKKSTKILLMYDLIPLIFSKEYLTNQQVYDDYFYRFKNIFTSNLILTISQTTKNDLHTYLNIPEKKVYNIGGGGTAKKLKGKRPIKLYTTKPFFIFPSGDNWRKNNERTIAAFKEFNRDRKYCLLITSKFSDSTKKLLQTDSSDIVFTNHLPDENLFWLYENCNGVVFPSIYEGLGLPVLEAVEFNKPILLSNIPVFKELEQKNFVWCNCRSVKSISEGFYQLCNKTDIKYDTAYNNNTWKNTLNKIIDLLLKSINQEHADNKVKKIALVGPDPQSFSAIGKFCQELLPYLSDKALVDFYYERPTNASSIRPNYYYYVWNSYPISSLRNKIKNYDNIIYNIGNSEFHIQTLLLALLYPSEIILHEVDLTELFQRIVNLFPQWNIRNKIESNVQKMLPKQSNARFITTLVNRQFKVICHSKYSYTEIRKILISQNTDLVCANLPSQNPLRIKKNHKKINISVSGHISHNKDLISLIKILSKVCEQYNIYVFGHKASDNLFSELRFLAEKKKIKIFTSLSDYEFQSILKNTDFIISLRSDYKGEASKSVFEAMRFGAIPIVTDIGWFKEIPDNLSIKVKNTICLERILKDSSSLQRILDNYPYNEAYQYLLDNSYQNYCEIIYQK